MGSWLALALLTISGITLVLQHDTGPIAGLRPVDFAALLACLGLVIFVATPMLSRERASIWSRVRLGLWALLILGAAGAGFLERDEIAKFASSARQALKGGTASGLTHAAARGGRAFILRRNRDGLFATTGKINGVRVGLVVDTGAASVLLRYGDARRAGVDPATLDYSVPVKTANGVTYAATTRLNAISLGAVGLRNVEGLVARQGTLDKSLLGIGFLSRLGSYEVAGSYLTLQQ